MSALAVVLKKELVDNVRDKRALSTALLTPAIGVLMLPVIYLAIAEGQSIARAAPLPVVGAEHAPELVNYLTQNGFTIKDPPIDPESAVKTGEADVILRIPPTYGAALREGAPARLEMIVDQTRTKSAFLVGRLAETLGTYSQTMGTLRLMMRGVDPQLATPVIVERVNVGAKTERVFIMMMIPAMLLISCLVGAVYVAIDVTAGERERGSLESLLYNPVRAEVLLFAKVIATAMFGLLAAVVCVGGFFIVTPLVPFDQIGMPVQMSARIALLLLLLHIPTVILGAAGQVLVGTLAKTTKGAQAALGMMMFVPLAPAYFVVLFPQQPSVTNSMIPFFAESILATRLIRGEPIDPLFWIITAASELVLAGVCALIAARLFGPRMLSG